MENIRISENYKEYSQQEYTKLQESMPNIHAIPCEYVSHLYADMEKYTKKAKKYNIPYNITELGSVTIRKNYQGKMQDFACIILQVNFEIKLNGWLFVATIDHMENGNIIRSVFGTDLPQEYRTSKSTVCDHCKTLRYRTQTFVVYNEETKEFKQVGRSCLKLYTGIDVNKVSATFDVFELFKNYEGMGCGEIDYDMDFCGHPKRYLNILSTLAIAQELVRVYGYAKRDAEHSTYTRVFEVVDYLNGDMKKYYPRHFDKFDKFVKENNLDFTSSEAFKKAEEIKDFILSQKDNSEYMHNMRMIFSEPTTDFKYAGYVISAVACYNREMEKTKKYQEQHENETKSKHIASVGDRVKVIVKNFKIVTSWDNQFGTTFIYKFVDKDNNIYTWKTSKHIDEALTLTGTVKAHNEYKGIKQTELTRCKV